MRFRAAVQATQEVSAYLKPRLQALNEAAQASVDVPDPKRLSGSLDIDAALRPLYPNAALWDYAIGYRIDKRDDRVDYVEHHKCRVSEVDRILRKKQWLQGWLAGKPLNGLQDRRFVWLSAGSLLIPQNSPQARLLRQHGLLVVRRLRLSAP